MSSEYPFKTHVNVLSTSTIRASVLDDEIKVCICLSSFFYFLFFPRVRIGSQGTFRMSGIFRILMSMVFNWDNSSFDSSGWLLAGSQIIGVLVHLRGDCSELAECIG